MSYDLTVFIGRFQPFHRGHFSVVKTALENSHTVLVCVGSSGQPRTTFNPFTYEERVEMIKGSLHPLEAEHVMFSPIFDYTYNDEQWVIGVQDAVAKACKDLGLDHTARIALIGHSKDHSSFYLKLFPQWESINVAGYESEEFVLSATDIRDTYFLTEKESLVSILDRADITVTPHVSSFLTRFVETDAYNNIVGEFQHVQKYKEPYKGLPYPPIFVTVDACVVQSGHVLLVQRRARPGKGLWALPGGFLNASERIEDAVYRELREETKIKVPEPVLRGSTVTSRVFDDVNRSARGRTITHAFLIHLQPDTNLPKVKGADDAEKAKWFPIANIRRDMMFEDHYAIITALTGLL